MKPHIFFHLSDIHIRLHHRHEEYQQVFSRVYEHIRLYQTQFPSHEIWIVITGDIFHHKVEFSPESLVLGIEFLRKLGELAPTIVIAGNHDMLQRNRDRLDNLSALFHERDISNVFYFKYSGRYLWKERPQIEWYVHSLLSFPSSSSEGLSFLEESDWDYVPSLELSSSSSFSTCRIGLYHGGVGRFRLQNRFEMEGEHSLCVFEKYNITMLGDIHFPQYLNSKKNIAYAGSLLSQNAGEGSYLHGYICWTCSFSSSSLTSPTISPTISSQFIEVPNPFAYMDCQLDWKDNLSPRSLRAIHLAGKTWTRKNEDQEESFWNDVLSFLPVAVRWMIYVQDVNEFQEFKSQCLYWANKLNISSQRWSWNRKIESMNSVSPSSSLPLASPLSSRASFSDMIYNMESMMVYVESFLKKQKKTFMLEKVRQHLEHVQPWKLSKSFSSSCAWSLEKIEGQHLFSYGSFVLDWTSSHSPPPPLLGIFGSNSSGKSTLIDIITLLLFGKITRYSHGNKIPLEVIHFKKESAWGKVTLRVQGDVIQIEKRYTRTKDKKKIKCVELLQKWDSTEQTWISLQKEDYRKTDAYLQTLIGTYEQFLFLCVQSQQPSLSFREMTQKERKEFLFDQFRLHVFEDIKEDFVQQYKEATVEKKRWQQQSQRWISTSLTQFEQQKQDIGKRLFSLSQTIQEKENECRQKQDNRVQLWSQKQPCTWSRHDIQSTLETLFQQKQQWNQDWKEECKQWVQQHTEWTTLSLFELEPFRTELQKQYYDAKERLASLQPPIKLVFSKELIQEFTPSPASSHQGVFERFCQFEAQCLMLREELGQLQLEKDVWEMKRKETLFQHQSQLRPVSSSSPFLHCQTIGDCEKEQQIWKRQYDEWTKKKKMFPSWIHSWGLWYTTNYPAWFEKWKCALERWESEYRRYQYHQQEYQERKKERDHLSQTRWNPSCDVCQSNPRVLRLKQLELDDLPKMEKEETEIRLPALRVVQKKCKELWKIWVEEQPGNDKQHDDHHHHHYDHLWNHSDDVGFVKDLEKATQEIKKRRSQREQDWKKYVAWKEDESKLVEKQKELEDWLWNAQWYEKIKSCQNQVYPQERRWKHCQQMVSSQPSLLALSSTRQAWILFREYEEDLKAYISKVDTWTQECRQRQKDMEHMERWMEYKKQKGLEKKWQKRMELVCRNEELDCQIQELDHSLQLLQECCTTLEKERQSLEKEEWILLQQEKEYVEWKEWGETMQNQLEWSEVMVSLLSRDGLPLHLLSSVLPLFEQRWNEALHGILPDFQICLHLEDSDLQFSILRRSDQTRHTYFFGGMENFMLNVSCKMVLHELSCLPKPPLFIMDEGVSVLDEHHLHELPGFFQYLQTLFSQVWIISHIPAIRDFVDAYYEIQKPANGFSVLTFHAFS